MSHLSSAICRGLLAACTRTSQSAADLPQAEVRARSKFQAGPRLHRSDRAKIRELPALGQGASSGASRARGCSPTSFRGDQVLMRGEFTRVGEPTCRDRTEKVVWESKPDCGQRDQEATPKRTWRCAPLRPCTPSRIGSAATPRPRPPGIEAARGPRALPPRAEAAHG